MRALFFCVAVLWVVCGVGGGAPAAYAEAEAGAEDTGDAALAMLVEALGAADGGGGNLAAVRALRHLREADLEPVFLWLSKHGSAAMRRQGLLGAAELRDPAAVPLERFAAIEVPAELAATVSAALDEGLLGDADARVMLGWPGLDVAVKEMIALEVLGRGQPLGDTAWLRKAVRHQAPGRAALAALLLHELGDAAGTAALNRLLDDEADNTEQVQAVVLQTAVAQRFTRIGGWAFLVASGEGSPGLRELAMRTALALGEPRGVALWEQQWHDAEEVSGRARLALLALRAAPATQDAVFEVAAGDDDPFIRQIAAAGIAVGQPGEDTAERVAALLRFDHPVADAWALRYAQRDAPPEVAASLLSAFVERYEPGRVPTRARRLDMVMQATQTLTEEYPESAARVLSPLLSRPWGDIELLDAVMLGLVRSGSPTARALAEKLSPAAPASTQMLGALVVARDPAAVTDTARSDLGLAVRGGGPLDASLRAQAAWLYLRAVGRAGELASALRDRP